jgi:hypothetical protein
MSYAYLRFRPNGPYTLVKLILLPLSLVFSSFGFQARPRLASNWNILSWILFYSVVSYTELENRVLDELKVWLLTSQILQ